MNKKLSSTVDKKSSLSSVASITSSSTDAPACYYEHSISKMKATIMQTEEWLEGVHRDYIGRRRRKKKALKKK